MQRGLSEGVEGAKHGVIVMVRNRESAGITGASWSTDRWLRRTEKHHAYRIYVEMPG